jgi:hypothetical protein
MKKHHDQPINEVLNGLLKKGPLKSGYYDSQIKKIWREKLGTLILNHTSSIYFAKGTIYLKISSAALRQELFMGKQSLKERFNEELGEKIVNEVILQ